MDDARAETTAPPSGFPLILAPLLSPFRHHRHLSLRVERLPHGARLSRGNNNGDRTWSLRSDELDDLRYLLPEGMEEAHTLLIRILDPDQGVTLAVLDFPVTPGTALPGLPPAPAAVAATPASSDAPPGDDGELRRLRDQLTLTTASLAVREAELAEARQMLEHARAGSGNVIETELAAARAAWEVQTQERLAAAAAEAAATLAQSRAAWEAEHQGRFAGVEAQMEQRLKQARGLWQQETQAILSKVEAGWKANEVARSAAAEARWRAESARVLTDTKARAEQAEAALAGANARAQLAEAALAEANARAERAEAASAQARPEEEMAKAHALWQQETQVALAQAEARWRADEAARLAAVEAKWRKDADARSRKEPASALAGAKARFEQAEAALAQAQARIEGDALEMQVLREELEQVKATLALRESELAGARSTRERQDQRADVGQRQRVDPFLAELHNDARTAAPSGAEPQSASAAPHDDARAAAETQSESADAGQRQQADPLSGLYNDARQAATSRPAAPAGQRRSGFGRRLIRVGVLAAVVATAVMLYPRFGPEIVERWWPKNLLSSTSTDAGAHKAKPPIQR